jgi:hypothetical protein
MFPSHNRASYHGQNVGASLVLALFFIVSIPKTIYFS